MQATWIKRGFWVAGGRALSALMTFGQNMVLTRLLPAQDVGIYFLVLSFTWGASLIAQWGTSTEVVRQIGAAVVQGDEQIARRTGLKALLSTAARGLAISAGLLLLSREVYLHLFHADLAVATRLLIALLCFATTLQTLIPEVFRAFHRVPAAAVLSGPLPNLFCLGGFFYLASRTQAVSLNDVLIVTGGASLIALVLALPWLWTLLRSSGERVEKSMVPSGVASAVAAAQIASYILNQADVLCLGSAVPKDQLAIYAAAQKLTLILLMPMTVVGSLLLAKLAELWASQRRQALQDVLSAGGILAFVPALVVWFIYLVAGSRLLGLVYGDFYRQGFLLLIVLSSFQLFHVAMGLSGYVLLMAGEQRAMMKLTIVGAIISLSASFVLSRLAGTMGAAIGSGCGLVVATVWAYLRARDALQLDSKLAPRAFYRVARSWFT